jgi:hypothetical protein
MMGVKEPGGGSEMKINTRKEGKICILLEVPWLDSSGIGEVVACHKRAVENRATMTLVMIGRAHDIFTNLELQRVVKIHDNMESALASFAK